MTEKKKTSYKSIKKDLRSKLSDALVALHIGDSKQIRRAIKTTASKFLKSIDKTLMKNSSKSTTKKAAPAKKAVAAKATSKSAAKPAAKKAAPAKKAAAK